MCVCVTCVCNLCVTCACARVRICVMYEFVWRVFGMCGMCDMCVVEMYV